MSKLNNKRGISLIVLVITIIVMIILAAAIILSLQSSGIIGRANEAKTKSDIANKKQAATAALAEYELEKQMGTTDKTATRYVQDKLNSQNIDGTDIAVTEDGEILVGLKKSAISAIEKGVKIGEYVDYSPTVATSTDYKVCKHASSAEAEDAAYFTTQTGENALKWKYMGIDDKGNAILVSELPTNDGLLLSGADGYVDGPSMLNDLCMTLYSNSALGDARSINIDDVNKVLGANPVPEYNDENNNFKKNTEWLTIGELLLPGTTLKYTVAPEEGKNINDYVSDWYTYKGVDYKGVDTPEYNLIFKKDLIGENGEITKSNISYWVATTSVYVDIYNGSVDFSMYRIWRSMVGYFDLFTSKAKEESSGYAIRPVIVLNSDVQFGTNTGGVWSIS